MGDCSVSNISLGPVFEPQWLLCGGYFIFASFNERTVLYIYIAIGGSDGGSLEFISILQAGYFLACICELACLRSFLSCCSPPVRLLMYLDANKAVLVAIFPEGDIISTS